MQEIVTNDNDLVAQSVSEETAAATADIIAIPVQPVIGEYKKRSGFKYGCYRFVKRLFDILSAGILFLILSPFLLIFLLIKWLEDFHNPVYVSWRVPMAMFIGMFIAKKNNRRFNFLLSEV